MAPKLSEKNTSKGKTAKPTTKKASSRSASARTSKSHHDHRVQAEQSPKKSPRSASPRRSGPDHEAQLHAANEKLARQDEMLQAALSDLEAMKRLDEIYVARQKCLKAEIARLSSGEAIKNHCPKCCAVLVEEPYEQILIDRCAGCGGVFFDPGEIDALLSAMAHRFGQAGEKAAGWWSGLFNRKQKHHSLLTSDEEN